jgi:membrane-associated protease RseP (regulator of RpoE activity)
VDEEKSEGLPARPAMASFFAKNRVWLNGSLFVLTIFSAFIVGINWSANYKYAEKISSDPRFIPPAGFFKDPQVFWLSVLYAVVLIAILLGHELGHYLTCRHYRIEATLPFFIPAPGFVGTLGAFIRIKSPITRKQQLFDIGVSGPLVSFLLALPALTIGLALSKVVPVLPREGSFFLGEPLFLKIVSSLFFKNVGPGYDLVLHPVAFAGWVGLLVTALNLFPLGQLDGGHVSYAVLGSKSKIAAKIFLAVYFIMAVFFWVGWLVWALLILLLGIRHPRILDEDSSLGTKRTIIGVLVLIIFILSFIPDPIKGYNIIDLIKPYWP